MGREEPDMPLGRRFTRVIDEGSEVRGRGAITSSKSRRKGFASPRERKKFCKFINVSYEYSSSRSIL